MKDEKMLPVFESVCVFLCKKRNEKKTCWLEPSFAAFVYKGKLLCLVTSPLNNIRETLEDWMWKQVKLFHKKVDKAV